MDQGWKWLPLLVVLLIFWRSALGFTGGVSSNTHPRWGRPADNSLLPRTVQSSLSEGPVTEKFSVEVGSGVLPERSQKSRSRFPNLRQYVKGGVSSSYESTSRTQTVPSGSVSGSSALPQDEYHTGSLTPVQLQGSSSSSVQNIASQLSTGQGFRNQYTSSSQGSSGPQSAGGSSQVVSLQGEGSNSVLSSSISSQFTPDLHAKFSSSSLVSSSQATSDQSSPSLYMSSFPRGSDLLLEALGSSSGQGGVGSFADLSLQSQGTSSQYAPATSGQLVSSPVGVSSQSASDKSTLGLYASSSQSSSARQSTEVTLPVYSQGSLSSNPSIQVQGSPSQDSSRPELAGGSRQQTSQELSGSYGGLSQSVSSQYSPGSLTLSSMPLKFSSQPTGAQSSYMSSAPSRSGTPVATSSRYVPVERGSSFRDLSSAKTQGTSAQYAPASPSKYAQMSSPQAVSSQSGQNPAFYRPVAQVGPLSQAGAYGQFIGGSSYYSGSIPQAQGSVSQYPPASPSKYVSMSSPQGVSTQSTSVVSSQGSSGTLLGAASRFASPGLSSIYGGSLQSQGTTSQLASGSPTYSKLSSMQLVSSQSTSDQSSGQRTPTLQVGSQPQEASRQFVSPQGGSSYYSGSLPQSQGSFNRYAPASSKYVSMSSPQGLSSQSESAPSSRSGLTSTFLGSSGSQSGSSLGLQSSSTYGGSYSQPQSTVSQFAPGSPSQYGSVSLSSPQSVSSQYSPESQSVYSQSQKPQRWQPSTTSLSQGVQSSGAAMSQGSYQSQSIQMPSRSSSLSSAVDSTYQTSPQMLSRGSGQLGSTQGRVDYYSGMSLQSPSTSSLYTLGSPAYPKLGSSPLGFSSQATSDQSSLNLYGSSSQTRADARPASSRYASLQGGSSSVGSAFQPQSIAGQYAPAPLSVEKTPVSSLYSQASPSGSSQSLSQQLQRWQPSASSWTQGVQTSDTAAVQSIPSSVQTSSRFSSPLPALSRPVDSVDQSAQTSTSWRSQGLSVVQRPSRLLSSQAAPSSTISSQMLQRPADSNLTPSSGLSAQKSSVGLFSGLSLPQNAQTQSGYESYNQGSSTSVTGEYAPSQRFIGNYEQSVGQGASSSVDLRGSGSLFGQNVPVSKQPSRFSSGRFFSSVRG